MAYQPVPNVAHVKLEGVVDGQLTVNDIYFEVSGGGITPVNLAFLTNGCLSWFINELAPLLSEDWSTTRAIGTDLTTVDGPSLVFANATPGGVAGEAAPNNVAACVSLRTISRGRSARGRNYVPAIPNSLISLNTMDAGFMADLLSAYAILIGAGTFLAGWQMVVVSRVTGGVLRANGVPFPVIAATFTKPTVSSMRSRSVGHGL